MFWGKGIETLRYRVESIQTFPRPETITQLHTFLDMYNLYRRFIPKTFRIETPLWNDEAKAAFTVAKQTLANVPLLKFSVPGVRFRTFGLMHSAIGSFLMQLQHDLWEPIAFFSLKLNKRKTKWFTYDPKTFSYL
ncbi:reverse transcriptase [Caerostris extrusa]|uniref:Reverse transcriptase n=1 Tax=Caerostris extrusa TaxID=172846 RepID=A0AAV4NYA5_CAEEX|nr:reverse transcriptase [Caerostris extrusa]